MLSKLAGRLAIALFTARNIVVVWHFEARTTTLLPIARRNDDFVVLNSMRE